MYPKVVQTIFNPQCYEVTTRIQKNRFAKKLILDELPLAVPKCLSVSGKTNIIWDWLETVRKLLEYANPHFLTANGNGMKTWFGYHISFIIRKRT